MLIARHKYNVDSLARFEAVVVWIIFWIAQGLFFIFYARLIKNLSTIYPEIFVTFAPKVKGYAKIKSNGIAPIDSRGVQGEREDPFNSGIGSREKLE